MPVFPILNTRIPPNAGRRLSQAEREALLAEHAIPTPDPTFVRRSTKSSRDDLGDLFADAPLEVAVKLHPEAV